MTKINVTPMSLEQTQKCLNLRDLTNSDDGKHCMQELIEKILDTLANHWNNEVETYRESPIVSIEDNYDRIGYPKDGASRDSRYSRYVCNTALLRTMTSAMIPRAMQSIQKIKDDILISCPGICYRRDSIDKIHTGEPHQLDLWRLTRNKTMTVDDLHDMIKTVVEGVLPNMEWRIERKDHPYTTNGYQVDVLWNGKWLEIAECGIASKKIINENYLDSEEVTGLAMGLGVDRVLMALKNIQDIRLLRSEDTRITEQMLDLAPYKEVSSMPPVVRDMSVAVDNNMDLETIGDKVRDCLDNPNIVELVDIISETNYKDLHEKAIERLGIISTQKNVLIRVVLRSLEKTLTSEECNKYRNIIYTTLHEGSRMMLAEN